MKYIYYNISEIPENCIPGEELNFSIQWETAFSEGDPVHTSSIRNEELNELLEVKARSIVKEKNGCCIHIRKESIRHSISYAHGSHIVYCEYSGILYKEEG